MKAMQIYIEEEQHKELKRIYAETGQRITDTVRKAIEAYLNGTNNKQQKTWSNKNNN